MYVLIYTQESCRISTTFILFTTVLCIPFSRTSLQPLSRCGNSPSLRSRMKTTSFPDALHAPGQATRTHQGWTLKRTAPSRKRTRQTRTLSRGRLIGAKLLIVPGSPISQNRSLSRRFLHLRLTVLRQRCKDRKIYRSLLSSQQFISPQRSPSTRVERGTSKDKWWGLKTFPGPTCADTSLLQERENLRECNILLLVLQHNAF